MDSVARGPGFFDKIPGGNNFGDSDKVTPSEDLEVNTPQDPQYEKAEVKTTTSNTASRISLKCSDHNGAKYAPPRPMNRAKKSLLLY